MLFRSTQLYVTVDGIHKAEWDEFTELDTRSPRPVAFGVVNLGPGVHSVTLTAQVPPGNTVTFDGVRIFP